MDDKTYVVRMCDEGLKLRANFQNYHSPRLYWDFNKIDPVGNGIFTAWFVHKNTCQICGIRLFQTSMFKWKGEG